MRRKATLFGLVACGWLLCHPQVRFAAAESVDSSGASRPAATESASADGLTLSQRLLLAEAQGDLEERARLAAELEQLRDPDQDMLGQWVLGKLRDRRDWKSVDDVIAANSQLPAIDRYEQFRRGQPDTVLGHMRTAMWCRQAGLNTQQFAHWQHVLQLDANNQPARTALGHRLINGQWVAPEDQLRQQQQAVAYQASLAKHGKKLIELRGGMLAARQAERDLAVERFFAIQDADAVPAVATVFAATPIPLMEHAIRWLSYHPDPAASDVLARWSIEQPTDHIRFQCARALARRPYHEFVPQLLDRTRTPFIATALPTYRRDGSLAAVQQVFAREGKDNYEVTVASMVNMQRRLPMRRTVLLSSFERDLQRQLMQINNVMTERQVRAAAARTMLQNQQLAMVENMSNEIINERVQLVLAQAAGTEPDAELPELWDWWDAYTERQSGPKLSSYSYNLKFAPSTVYGPAPRSCECFVAGTPVITARGEKPIESLIVGDQVLSKNIQTGRLVWDVVTRTTEQPAQPLMTVKTDQEQFRCTGGHLFWVSGKGWTKARDLADGDVLHGLERPSVVGEVIESQAEPTYNLVTSRHHNYFVGESHTLSHDFAEQTPTAVRVPGLDYALHRP